MSRRVHLLLFLTFFSAYAYFYNGGGGNQAARLNQTRAILSRGTLYHEGIGFPSDDNLYVYGHLYSNKAPGTSLLGAPFFAFFKAIVTVLDCKGAFWDNWVVHMATVFAVGAPSAWMALLLYLVLVGMGVGPPAALMGALSVGLGTIFFPYATMFFGHSLAGALAFASFYLIRSSAELRRRGLSSERRVFFAALLVGSSVLVEYPMAIAAVALSSYLLLTRPPMRELRQWTLGGTLAAALLALYNIACFGSPLALSYLNYEQSQRNNFPEMARGLGGVTAPKLAILREILWGNARGIVWFSPVLLLVLPGLIYLFWRRRDLWREGVTLCLMIGGFLAFNAGYGDSIRYWGGANSAGPRHLIPMLPFAGVALGLFFEAAPLIGMLFLIPSIVICLAVTAVMPQVPMLYSAPLRQFIVPYFLEGRLALHRGGVVSRALVTSDSIAYNWGKLMGMPGSWALAPLYLVTGLLLAGVLLELFRRSFLSRRGFVAGSTLLLLTSVSLLLVPPLHQRAQARPLAGPGVLGTYYAGQSCEGTPIRVARESDLSFMYHQEDVRPYPDYCCAEWITRLEVPSPGVYGLRTYGAAAEIWIDGQKVPLVPTSRWRQEGMVTLAAGPHELRIETILSLVLNQFEVRWRRHDTGFEPIPPERLHTP